jgi:hypothetical protein
MRGNRLPVLLLLLVFSWLAHQPNWMLAQTTAEQQAQKLDEFLSQGKLVAAASHFRTLLEQQPANQTARLALGLTEFFQALEFLGNSNYRFGILNNSATESLPLLRLPVPENPNPDQVSYDELRSVVEQFQSRIRAAEEALGQVETGDVYLPLYLGRVRLDLNGDGVMADEETLWRLSQVLNPQVEQAEAEAFFIGIDGADVHWLRGYCHFLQAVCDVVLAHDERQLFERCGHLVFPKIETPFLAPQDRVRVGEFEPRAITDLIAALHLIRFPVTAPERMRAAHGHLLAMVGQSRLCWERTLAEKDNRNEWIPNPEQTGVLGVAVPREVLTGWSKVLDEIELLLEGKKLIPYWREYSESIFGFAMGAGGEIPEQGKGLNLRQMFYEPQEFDLILWLQGTGVESFLEEGPLSTPEAWNRLTQVFEGQFFGFALWFN